MITVTSKTKATVAALAMAASFGASAVPITLTDITGSYKVWAGDPVLVDTDYSSPSSAGFDAAKAALGGNAAAPDGNVELSKFGGPVGGPATLLSGTGNGHTITLSSLLEGDWTDALATRYIQDAATAAFGSMLTPGELAGALFNFFHLSVDAAGHKPWQLVSDPNISYMDVTGNTVSLGLAGLFDAGKFLHDISGVPLILLAGKQASEVVKMSFDGSDPIYLYGFVATESGVHATDGVSYSGNYAVKFTPEPAGLALFGLGLLGLLLTRRRR